MELELVEKKSALCLYHSNCSDGFGASWVVKKYFDEREKCLELLAVTYGNTPPDVKDREVIIVDFCYNDLSVLQSIYDDCKSLTIIDHHDTAIDTVKEFIAELGFSEVAECIGVIACDKLTTYMSNKNSGVVLTWKYFYPTHFIPNLLLHIEDRDLWNFNLDGTREVIAALFSYPFDYNEWDLYVDNVGILQEEGSHILRAHNNSLKNLLSYKHRFMTIGGYCVPVMNVATAFASDVGNALSKGYPFSATYIDTDSKRLFSLRSSKDEPLAIHVGNLAKTLGGGGHKHAAGFTIPFEALSSIGLL